MFTAKKEGPIQVMIKVSIVSSDVDTAGSEEAFWDLGMAYS